MKAAAEAEAEAEALQERPDREPITISSADQEDAQAKKEEFRRRIREHEQAVDRKAERKLDNRLTNRERVFAMLLRRFWREASWIEVMQEFPDGRPLRSQRKWFLDLWSLFISAINRRKFSGKNNSRDDLNA